MSTAIPTGEDRRSRVGAKMPIMSARLVTYTSSNAVTNLDAFITTMTGNVDLAGNTSIYAYSYRVFTLRTLLEYLFGIHIQMVQLLGIMMDILIPTGENRRARTTITVRI